MRLRSSVFNFKTVSLKPTVRALLMTLAAAGPLSVTILSTLSKYESSAFKLLVEFLAVTAYRPLFLDRSGFNTREG